MIYSTSNKKIGKDKLNITMVSLPIIGSLLITPKEFNIIKINTDSETVCKIPNIQNILFFKYIYPLLKSCV